jgi:hypothetical protein
MRIGGALAILIPCAPGLLRAQPRPAPREAFEDAEVSESAALTELKWSPGAK